MIIRNLNLLHRHVRMINQPRFFSDDGKQQLEITTYHQVADDYLDNLSNAFEQLEEKIGIQDLTLADGVLTVKLNPSKGTYVINKQTPNRQIWLSSPVSGPKRFDYHLSSSAWLNSRDHQTSLDQLLHSEINQLFPGASLRIQA